MFQMAKQMAFPNTARNIHDSSTFGCCGLALVCVVNGKTYGRVTVGDVHNIIDEWRKKFDDEDKELAHG